MASPTAAGRLSRHAQFTGVAIAVTAACCYGANIPAVRSATLQGVTPTDLIFYRSLLLVPVLALIASASGQSLSVPVGSRRSVLALSVAAACTGFSYITAVSFLPVPEAATLFYSYPLIVMALTPLVDRTRIARHRFGVFPLAFFGLLLAIGPVFADLDPRGLGFAALAAACCAWLFFAASRQGAPPLVGFFWAQVAVGIGALVLGLSVTGIGSMERLISAGLPVALTIAGFFAGFGLQLLAARTLSAASMGLIFLIEPVTSITAAALVLGETVSPLQMGGIGLVLLALGADAVLGMRRR